MDYTSQWQKDSPDEGSEYNEQDIHYRKLSFHKVFYEKFHSEKGKVEDITNPIYKIIKGIGRI